MKQKVRNRFKSPTHFNPYAGTLTASNRQKVYGKGRAPVKGKALASPMSEFLGSVLTPENTNEYKRKQIEYYKERFIADVVIGREKIQAQEDKTPEEIEVEVDLYNKKQPDEILLHEMAIRFATKMVTKENKHHAAYLKGDIFYTYNGQKYPVLTQNFVKQTQSFQEILKQAKEADDIRARQADSENPLEVSQDGTEGDNEALRSDTGDFEDSEVESTGIDPRFTPQLLSNNSGDQ